MNLLKELYEEFKKTIVNMVYMEALLQQILQPDLLKENF
jgi:hypothetical protein